MSRDPGSVGRLGIPAVAISGVVGLGAIAGAVVARSGPATVVVLATVIVLLLAVLVGSHRLTSLLVGATYASRLRLAIPGFRLLPDQLLLVPLFLAALVEGRLGQLRRGVGSPTVRWMGAYVLWSGAISVIRSPAPVESIAIVGWLFLSWLLLLALASWEDRSEQLEAQIIGWGGVAGLSALVLFVVGRVTGFSFGTQLDVITGARPLYGLAFEANILGSTMAVTCYLALTASDAVLSKRVRAATVFVCGATLVLTLTRGAVLALLIGLVLWFMTSQGPVRMRAIKALPFVFMGLGVVLLANPSVSSTVVERASELVDLNSETAVYRFRTIDTALGDMDGAAWVFGLGTNSFGQRHLDPTQPDNPTPGYLGSVMVQIVYDGGVVSLVLLGLALVAAWPERGRGRSRALGLLVVVLVSSSTTSTLWFGSTWTLIALAAIRVRAGRSTGSPRPVGADRSTRSEPDEDHGHRRAATVTVGRSKPVRGRR